jgi:hypothetical protein
MQVAEANEIFACSNCDAFVERDASGCRACHADFNGSGGCRPVKYVGEPATKPTAFMVICFCMGITFLSYLASIAVFGTWDAVIGKRALGAGVLWAYFRFGLAELFPFLLIAGIFSFLLLRKARLPKRKWPVRLFGWATLLFALSVFVMLSVGLMAVVVAPFLFIPSFFLYCIGTLVVVFRLRAERANKLFQPTAYGGG